MNLYAYVVASPHVYVDPYGEGWLTNLTEGINTAWDMVTGDYQEEINDQQNDITRINMTNYRKARDRGDGCFAMSILQGNSGDMANIGGAANDVGDKYKDVVDASEALVTTPIPLHYATRTVKAIKLGKEYKIGKNLRIAPWGNRVNQNWAPGSTAFQKPHYHRRIVNKITGKTRPGGSMKHHRPWESGW